MGTWGSRVGTFFFWPSTMSSVRLLRQQPHRKKIPPCMKRASESKHIVPNKPWMLPSMPVDGHCNYLFLFRIFFLQRPSLFAPSPPDSCSTSPRTRRRHPPPGKSQRSRKTLFCSLPSTCPTKQVAPPSPSSPTSLKQEDWRQATAPPTFPPSWQSQHIPIGALHAEPHFTCGHCAVLRRRLTAQNQTIKKKKRNKADPSDPSPKGFRSVLVI